MTAPASATLTDRRFEVRYRIRGASLAFAEEAAAAIALERSVEVPLDAIFDEAVRERIVGRVLSVEASGEGEFVARIALAVDTTGDDVAQTLNMLFGNSSMHAHAELLDADLPVPREVLRRPRFGVEGLRRLTGACGRPLTCTALKPQGLPVAELARICHVFAAAGVDVIKDDHGIANQGYSPFAARIGLPEGDPPRRAGNRAHRALCAQPGGNAEGALEQAKILREEGVGAALVAPGLMGIPVFQELVAEHLQGPVLAHPSYAGTVRVAPAFIFGKLFRLLGADAMIYAHYAGRFAYSEAECASIAEAARRPWSGVRPACRCQRAA